MKVTERSTTHDTFVIEREQGAFFEGLDDVKQREQATRYLVDSLATSLKDDA